MGIKISRDGGADTVLYSLAHRMVVSARVTNGSNSHTRHSAMQIARSVVGGWWTSAEGVLSSFYRGIRFGCFDRADQLYCLQIGRFLRFCTRRAYGPSPEFVRVERSRSGAVLYRLLTSRTRLLEAKLEMHTTRVDLRPPKTYHEHLASVAYFAT